MRGHKQESLELLDDNKHFTVFVVFYSAGTVNHVLCFNSVLTHPGHKSPRQMKVDLLLSMEYVSSVQEQKGKSWLTSSNFTVLEFQNLQYLGYGFPFQILFTWVNKYFTVEVLTGVFYIVHKKLLTAFCLHYLYAQFKKVSGLIFKEYLDSKYKKQ